MTSLPAVNTFEVGWRRWRRLLHQASVGGITRREKSCEILPTKRRLVRKARGHSQRILYPVQQQLYPSRDSTACFVVGGPCSLSRENAAATSIHQLSDPPSTVRGDKLPWRNQRARPLQHTHVRDARTTTTTTTTQWLAMSMAGGDDCGEGAARRRGERRLRSCRPWQSTSTTPQGAR